MKQFGKILLDTITIVLCLIILTYCQTKIKQKDTEVRMTQFQKIPSPPEMVDTNKMLKEKFLTEYIILAKTVKPNLKNGQPFDKLDYDKVIAYDFAGSEEPFPAVIDRQGKFVPVVLGQ